MTQTLTPISDRRLALLERLACDCAAGRTSEDEWTQTLRELHSDEEEALLRDRVRKLQVLDQLREAAEDAPVLREIAAQRRAQLDAARVEHNRVWREAPGSAKRDGRAFAAWLIRNRPDLLERPEVLDLTDLNAASQDATAKAEAAERAWVKLLEHVDAEAREAYRGAAARLQAEKLLAVELRGQLANVAAERKRLEENVAYYEPRTQPDAWTIGRTRLRGEDEREAQEHLAQARRDLEALPPTDALEAEIAKAQKSEAKRVKAAQKSADKARAAVLAWRP